MKRCISIKIIAFMFGAVLHGPAWTAKGQNADSTFNKSVYVTGVVYDKTTMLPLSQSGFTINNRLTGTSDNEGRFFLSGKPGDLIRYTHIGYKEVEITLPVDTLDTMEYLMGIFMSQDTMQIDEIVIFPRIPYHLYTEVQNIPPSTQMADNARNNINNAVMQGLTKSPKVFDADMNARNTFQKHEVRAEYSGFRANPSNSLMISSSPYSSNRTYSVLYGAPVVVGKMQSKQIVTTNEKDIIIGRYQAFLIKKYNLEKRKREKDVRLKADDY